MRVAGGGAGNRPRYVRCTACSIHNAITARTKTGFGSSPKKPPSTSSTTTATARIARARLRVGVVQRAGNDRARASCALSFTNTLVVRLRAAEVAVFAASTPSTGRHQSAYDQAEEYADHRQKVSRPLVTFPDALDVTGRPTRP